MTGFLDTLFRYPDGIVLGNLIASLLWAIICAPFIYLTRHRWMPHLVAFHHYHKQLHASKLQNGPGSDEPR